MKDSKYHLVAVSTEGRSSFEAVANAMDALSLLRGLWSLFATYGSWSFSFGSPKRHPIGVIHTGPIHTLHLPDGKPAEDEVYWFDKHYIEDRLYTRKELNEIDKHRRWAVRKLTALPHKREVEDILIRYADALDQGDSDIAFLKMWGILEKITNTIGARYDDTIERTMSIYSAHDRQLAKELLECPRFRRNQYVHAGESTQASDQVAYLVKSFLDPHLVRLINNLFKVSALEEYAEHLALPTDIGVLEERTRRMNHALRLRKRSQSPELPKS
jgi:hypothetical protein